MADNNNPIKYSDLVSPDNSITDLIKQLDDLSDTYTNALKNIRAEAIQLSAVLKTVSGATEEGRRATKNASDDAERLAKAQRELAFAESENAKKLAELKHAQQEANAINKLLIKINNSAEGSYNRLSAQYSLNKIYLNNMSLAEREGTEAGRKLEEETKAIYEEMKRLQEATGKHQLNVGNYAEAMIDAAAAAEQMASKIEKSTKQLAMMKLEGKETTEEYQNLLQETATLKDAMADASAEVANMASDTSQLDAVLAGASAASGGFAAYTGAMELFGKESEDVEEAQRKLQAAIALATGVQQLQNAVQKQSALMLGVTRLQIMAKAKAEALATKGTVAATIAQKAFNIVAYANPYVLLAMALVAVVGALVAFSNNADDAAKKQSMLNEVSNAWLEYLEKEAEIMNQRGKDNEKQYERDLRLAQARGASAKELQEIEDKIYRQRVVNNARQRGFYAQEIHDVEENRKKLQQLYEILYSINQSKAIGNKKIEIDVDLDGKIDKNNIDEAIEAVQGQIDVLDKKVKIAVELETEQKNIELERQLQLEERKRAAEEMAKNELDIIRATEDVKISLLADTYAKQREQKTAENKRAIVDIKLQLQTESNLTEKARKSLNARIVYLEQQLEKELAELENQRLLANIAVLRKTEDLQIATMAEGIDKQRVLLQNGYNREIEDIMFRLERERALTETERSELNKQIELLTAQYYDDLRQLENQYAIEQHQREAERLELRLATVKAGSEEELQLRLALLDEQRKLELANNKSLAADMQQSEEDINKKYNAEIMRMEDDFNRERSLKLLEQRQVLAQSEFDLLRNSEERKTQFQLRAEKERLQELLRINEAANIKMSDMKVDTIKNTIARIDNEIKQSKSAERADIYGLFGLNLDDDQKEAIDTATSYAMDALQQYMDAYTAAADAKVQKADAEIESAQSLLDAEIEARNNGYAHNVQMAQKELDIAKKNQEKALKEQEKAQKAQAAIQTVQQIGNLITSSSLIWSQLGFPWAIPAIAVMWGSFAAAKIKAVQMTSQEYGEGTVELLSGGSHQSGNDVDLGVKPDGTRRRAEGGEFFAVINKRNSRRFRRYIPSVINSLNDGTFERKYLNAYNGEGLTLNVTGSSPDLRDLSEDVREIKEQNRRRIYTADGAIYESYKNLTRKIKRI